MTALQLVPIAKSLGDDNSSNRFKICAVKAELGYAIGPHAVNKLAQLQLKIAYVHIG